MSREPSDSWNYMSRTRKCEISSFTINDFSLLDDMKSFVFCLAIFYLLTPLFVLDYRVRKNDELFKSYMYGLWRKNPKFYDGTSLVQRKSPNWHFCYLLPLTDHLRNLTIYMYPILCDFKLFQSAYLSKIGQRSRHFCERKQSIMRH